MTEDCNCSHSCISADSAGHATDMTTRASVTARMSGSSAFHSSTNKPFRFMDMPAEVRDQVYANLLYPELDFEHSHDGAALFDTTILLTNRRIFAEARDVMLKKNKFVRIFARGVCIPPIMAKAGVPVVAHSHFSREDPIVRHFRGAVMTYFLRDEGCIEEHGEMAFNTCDMLIRHEDLGAFLSKIGDPLVDAGGLAMKTKHRVVIHDPFKRSKDPNKFSPVLYQTRLLQPFRDHLHGFTHFKIMGKVDDEVAATVRQDVLKVIVPEPEVFIESVKKLKDEGNALWRDGSSMEASFRWLDASLLLRRLRISKAWSQLMAETDEDFRDTLAELLFTVNINQMQAMLAEMREYDEDEVEELHDAMERVTEVAQMAFSSGPMFDSLWEPRLQQKAKMCYRFAQALRLVGDLPSAKLSIERAQVFAPGDPDIAREANEIARSALVMMSRSGFVHIPGL